MDAFVVRANGPLSGTVRVCGATKNAGLKQMAAALLAPGVTVLRNLHPVLDLDAMLDVMRAIGASADGAHHVEHRVDASGPLTPEAPYELVTRMRASINVLGPLLARCGEARVAMPGGDNIGSRKLDMHFRGLQAMGAELDIVHGLIEARCRTLCGARIVLDFPSVGATENLLTAAVLAKGQTVLDNAAREPEISDLAAFLNGMGAQISGAGSSTIEVEGVESLTPIENEVMGDRIEAGTILMACGVAGGEVTVEGTRLDHLEMVVLKLGEMGLDVATLPYPGFATDFMPLVVALLATAEGSAIVTENVFDNRFGFVDELHRMGADIRNEGRHAVVRGVDRLSGAPVRAQDVRAGAALVVAGLAADGETRVLDPYHVDRGYPDLAGQLQTLGADVRRVRPTA